MQREEILNYFINERKMSIVSDGSNPYWFYNFGDKSKDYDKNHIIVSVWLSHNPFGIEIHETIEGKCFFNGHIYSIDDLKRVLYLTLDCCGTKNGRPENEQILN